ncbi:cold shock and DUF1294 domain-containing protein [Acidovorax sp. Root70]|uniref:DUF1294 domain-containing protein n=1 Tax=Acidovorax sp. Root70 TaxID=1736590 RepID=UPI0006F7C30E|nr:cold shock and DUF1294 domain-containing protein [Acidovorax sp. Root70]KRB28635.1 DNA-binding protein [Acidovorax sp. Root70]
MQKQGTVIRWDAARAFGFIRSPDTSADVFFHVRDYRGSAAPREGLAVVYEEIHVGGKGPRAMAVQPAAHAAGAFQPRPPTPAQPASVPPTRRAPAQGTGQPQASRRRRPAATSASPAAGSMLIHILMLGWAALLAWGVWAGRLPGWVIGAALAINLLTFVIYAIDKSAAQNGRWRIKESHLHLLGLAGGWPGAWFAQQRLRHKSRKAEFRAVYWMTVVMHCAALGAWLGGWLR